MSNVREFGAVGDGRADDTEAIQHAVSQGDGVLHFRPGTYRITQPIEVRLAKRGPMSIDGTGGSAKVVMAGPGPAFRLVGTRTVPSRSQQRKFTSTPPPRARA